MAGSQNLGSVFDKSRSLVFSWFAFTFFESRKFSPKRRGLGFLTRISASQRVSDFTIRHPSYLKISSDSKRGGIKREHVIFTYAYLRSRQRRANYVYVSASAGQIWSWRQRGRERFWKNVRTSGKILATLLISHSAFAIVFLQLRLFCI